MILDSVDLITLMLAAKWSWMNWTEREKRGLEDLNPLSSFDVILHHGKTNANHHWHICTSISYFHQPSEVYSLFIFIDWLFTVCLSWVIMLEIRSWTQTSVVAQCFTLKTLICTPLLFQIMHLFCGWDCLPVLGIYSRKCRPPLVLTNSGFCLLSVNVSCTQHILINFNLNFKNL